MRRFAFAMIAVLAGTGVATGDPTHDEGDYNGAKPGGRAVDVAKLQKLVKDQGFLIDGGYGKIKGTTFRISNMGDETEATMNTLYAALDKAMAQL